MACDCEKDKALREARLARAAPVGWIVVERTTHTCVVYQRGGCRVFKVEADAVEAADRVGGVLMHV